jgi:hypothetical protein
MFGFGWMVWLVLFLLFCMMVRHRRRERWAHAVPRRSTLSERELEEQREDMDILERRVAELEERLDFTERLLAGRNQAASDTV